jgi:histidine ammonia-lyase
MTAARHAYEITENVRRILAIELFTAAQALDLRLKDNKVQLGKGTSEIYGKIREELPYKSTDALWGTDIEVIDQMIKNQRL